MGIHLWCVWLRKPNAYAMSDGIHGYSEVIGMQNAETFGSTEEAEEFISTREVFRGKVVKYHDSRIVNRRVSNEDA